MIFNSNVVTPPSDIVLETKNFNKRLDGAHTYSLPETAVFLYIVCKVKTTIYHAGWFKRIAPSSPNYWLSCALNDTDIPITVTFAEDSFTIEGEGQVEVYIAALWE